MPGDSAITETSAQARDDSFADVRAERIARGRGAAWEDCLGTVWLLVMPITSVLVLPGIQGTTPATLCAVTALFGLLAVRSAGSMRVQWGLAAVVTLFVLLQCASSFAAEQLPIGLEPHLTFTNMRRSDRSFLPTVLTQSAYLAVGVITALYAREFFDRRWENWIFAGAMLLIAYGFYEWLFFLKFQESGDFLSNRTFSDEQAFDPDAFSGSLVQTAEPLGIPVLRLKSLTGEPSMFALATLPYFFLAFCTQRYWIASCLLIGLLLSTSTTAMMALPVGFVLWICFRPGGWRLSYYDLVAGVLLCGAGIAILSTSQTEQLIGYFTGGLQEKLRGYGESGSERLESHQHSIEFFLEAPLSIKMFGLGFGATRPLAFFDWLLVNCGVIGTVIWLGIFLWPIVRLPGGDGFRVGLKVALSVTLLAMLVSVPEFAYPTTWLFLGLAYRRLTGGEDDS